MNTAPLIETDDEISFQLTAIRTIAQEDVRVSVDVTALVSTSQAHGEALEHRIREALNRLIEADWAFAKIRRAGEAVGFERVTLADAKRVSQRLYDPQNLMTVIVGPDLSASAAKPGAAPQPAAKPAPAKQ